MQAGLKLVVSLSVLMGWLSASSFGTGQSSSPSAKPRSDRQQEDAVAKLFDEVRTEAKLPPLSRIEDRKSLRQLACTVAVTDNVPRFRSGFPVLGNGSIDGITAEKEDGAPRTASALYKTSNPGEPKPELKRVALYERPRGPKGIRIGYARYSVAVWLAQQSTDDKSNYWVAVQLFWSKADEFFQNHFTDAMEWKNEWKQFVTPECKAVK
ncbi:MAG: hypothetical protein ACRD3Q_01540 [Terriglobales bacterium]